MLEVGWPDPALVEARIESTRNCAARSATTPSDTSLVSPVVVMVRSSPRDGGPCAHHNHMTTHCAGTRRPALGVTQLASVLEEGVQGEAVGEYELFTLAV